MHKWEPQSSFEVVAEWLRTLPEGAKIESRHFEGDVWVKRPNGEWNRGHGTVAAIHMLSFTLQWNVV